MATDFLIIKGSSQSNGVGTATTTATGGTTQDANGSDARRYPDITACTYYQLSADTPGVPGAGAQAYNTNLGPIPMRPYAASGNNISSAYAEVYLGIKHGLFANPMYAVHAVGSTTLSTYWFKGASTSLYTDEVALINARVAEAGRGVDVYVTHLGESDASSPANIAALSTQWATHMANLRADCPGMANALHVFVMVSPNAVLGGDGDVPSVRAAQLAYINANPTTTIGVDPYLIPLNADPHYRPDGYWSLGEKIINAIRARLKPTSRLDLSVGPTPWVQADGPIATTPNSTTVLKPRGAAGHVGELGGVDVQLGAFATYTQATTHTMEVGAGPAGGAGAGGTGLDGGFLQIGTQTDSVSTNHHAMSMWWRSVIDSVMTTDVFGRKNMPIPSVRCSASTLNAGQIATVRGCNPLSPISGFYSGTNDAFTTSLNIPKTAPGSPITVPAGALAVAYLGTNGATQTVTGVSNPDTGAWTIHRDQVVNPGAGSVGLAFASARCNGGQLRQTTVTYGTTGLNVGFVVVFNPLLEGNGTADAGPDVLAGAGLQILQGAGAGNIGADAAAGAGVLALIGQGTADLGGETTAGTGIQMMVGQGGAGIGADNATGAGSIGLVVTARLYGELALAGSGSSSSFTLIGPIRVFAGDSLDLVLSVSDDNDLPYDLSAVTAIEVQIKRNLGDPDPPLVAKSLGSGIVLNSVTVGRADITIGGSELALAPGLYWLDSVVIASGRRHHTTAPREFTVLDVVNQN